MSARGSPIILSICCITRNSHRGTEFSRGKENYDFRHFWIFLPKNGFILATEPCLHPTCFSIWLLQHNGGRVHVRSKFRLLQDNTLVLSNSPKYPRTESHTLLVREASEHRQPQNREEENDSLVPLLLPPDCMHVHIAPLGLLDIMAPPTSGG